MFSFDAKVQAVLFYLSIIAGSWPAILLSAILGGLITRRVIREFLESGEY